MVTPHPEQVQAQSYGTHSMYVSEKSDQTASFVSVQYHFVAALADETSEHSIWDIFF